MLVPLCIRSLKVDTEDIFCMNIALCVVSGVPGGGFGVFKPPPPLKFRSFDKAEPNFQFRGKYIRRCLECSFSIILISLKIAEFRTPTPQDVRKKAVNF
jgi:hypothetical protein